MITVWKQPIQIDDTLTLYLPRGAKVLTVQMQHGEPCIWFLCDPENPDTTLEARHFVWLGTGHNRDFTASQLAYVGTVQMEGGSLIFHLFEVVEAKEVPNANL